MRLIGLTGGIGSGKSTVGALLEELGARRIDTDKVGHEVYQAGKPAFDDLVAEFGADIVGEDGRIDRKALAERVFGDPERLTRLNAIVHPRIGEEVARRIAAHRETDPDAPVVLEVPLLVGSALAKVVDEIWVVVTSRELALERTSTGRGVAREELEQRMARQASDEERLAIADVVIENDGSLDHLRNRVEALYRERLR